MKISTLKKFIFGLSLFFVILSPVSAKPKVALVLSGGGAKGFAEIPFLEAIEREGIKVDMVLGTSMGALIGSLYASGYTPKEIRNTLLNMDFIEILANKPVKLERMPPEPFCSRTDSITLLSYSKDKIGSAPGLIGDQNILNELNNHLSKVLLIDDFDKLPIPFRAIGTNVSTGEQVIFKNGSIVKAVRGSISIPVAFTPAPAGNGIYVMDGGLRNNLPVKLAREMGADIVIAMDVASIVDTDPTTISDFYAVSVQIFNLIISSNAVEQYKYCDLLLRPDLSGFSTLNFTNPKDVVHAGEICVEQNKDAIHDIALKIQKLGAQLENFDYDRESIYSKLPDFTVQSVSVVDASFSDEEAPLPNANEFMHYLGKKFTDKERKSITSLLNDLRTQYHLTSLTYNLKKGTNENECHIEILANYYNQKMSKIFLSGGSTASIEKKPDSDLTFRNVPSFTAGTYILEPVNGLIRLSTGNATILDASIYTPITKIKKLKIDLDFGGEYKYGSLEPFTHLAYKNRTVNKDKGYGFHAGTRLSYSDMFAYRLGIAFFSEDIYSTDETIDYSYAYTNVIVKRFYNDISSIKGYNIEAEIRAGTEHDHLDPIYDLKFNYNHRFELIENTSAIGFDIQFSRNRFPYQLNEGYYEFGGIEGMCGLSNGSFYKDCLIAGVSYNHKLFDIIEMPVFILGQAKFGLTSNSNPYGFNGETGETLINEDFGNMTNIVFGAAAFITCKTPIGTFVLGGGGNSDKNWCIYLGFK